MKKIKCVVLSILLICALSFSINTNAAEQNDDCFPREISTNDNSNEHQAPLNITEEPPVEGETTYTDIPIDKQYMLDVNEVSNPNLYESVTEYIPVESIELSDFNEEMYVKDTQNLSAVVFPTTATEQIVHYSSSDSTVAKVSQTGKLTAVGSGSCRIYLTCDNLTVYYDLKVKIKTESVNVKSKFVVMKPGKQYNLEANVQPIDACQSLTFKSKDDSIATVSNNGIITAKSVGSTSVVVSNDDITILVNVMVSADDKEPVTDASTDNNTENLHNDIDELTRQIKNSNDKIIVVEKIDKVSSSVLKELYGTDKTLVIKFDEYDISIRGQDIFNANNEISTKLVFSHIENGILVEVNDNKLPGTISITLKKTDKNYKYLYIVDKKKNDYKRLNTLSNNKFKINSAGKYMLTTKEINRFKINIVWIFGGVGVILLLSLIYIFTKKKYWFW